MILTEPSLFTCSFSYPNGEPQTPTRTPPTTTIFGDSAFQTPKLESSFFDPRVTWDTSDPYASSPEFLRTPQKFGIATPSINPLRLPDTGSDRPLDAEPNLRSAKPSEQETDTAKRRRPSKPNGFIGEDCPRTGDSAKSAATIQTPPPSSASRRKMTELREGKGTGRRTSDSSALGAHLETPSRIMGASPRLFNFTSSPDPFQLGPMHPSASPLFPQQRLFWDQDLGNHEIGMGLSTSGVDLFAPQTSGPFQLNPPPLQDSHIPQLPTIEGHMELPEFNSNGFNLSSTTTTDAALFPAPFSTSPRLPITKAEDPAMFLSSPARRFGGPQPTPEKRLFGRPTRQPYHHQTEESKREELRRVQSVHQQLSAFDNEDDDYTPRQTRPMLTRSLTHTAVTSSSSRSGIGSTMSSTNGIRKSPSKGRLSPVKSMRQSMPRSTSAASLPTRSQSLVLKIGRDGRAKTEMQPVQESATGLTDPITAMDLEGSTTESEYDSVDYSEYPILPSRNPSFAFSDAGRSVTARSDSGSRPHSKGSYTSTAASSQSGRMSPWNGSARGLSRRPQYKPTLDDWKRTPKRQTGMLHSDLSYLSAGSLGEPFDDVEEDSGDAQHALRKVLQERGRPIRPHTVSYSSRIGRANRSLAHLRSSPPRFGAELDIGARAMNTSPTTMTDPDIATPITDRFSNPSRGTRCVCHSMDNGGHLMIQCESCSHWLHTKCVGLERANLPSVYVCVFCVAQTPTRKNNRVRVPLGGVGPAPTSPLAHKSYRFR
ncbi:PHD finger domain protein [Aspergillus homomorphus CBS 101889]|uniref:PHD-type domain-containing protein n=1 Tax=Aspergillus homomorphus (strain CBS 101889) TaxID=1450537 RepID=A0A395I9Q8_ASPHC|nr:hypothetical protein BO97DRAFT_439909 [Aspergillus homomorphus CBS 101889]RAL17000.1 hypothetical protein BO97DRAFT_439909 [Aspergillus homomorphus CBS 101889]